MVQDNSIRSFARSPGKRFLLLFYFSWFVLALYGSFTEHRFSSDSLVGQILEISMGDRKFRVCVVLNHVVL